MIDPYQAGDSMGIKAPGEPPEIMYDSDGEPIAVRRDQVPLRRKVVRYLAQEHDWYLEWVGGFWIEPEEEHFRYRLSEIREMVERIGVGHMRPWQEGDNSDSDYGKDAWFWCGPDEPGAVEYWDLDGRGGRP